MKKEWKAYFRKEEIILWCTSVELILLAFILFDRENYLTIKRSPYYAVAYAANDIVLIILWSLASVEEIRYLSVVVCFAAFFVNDIYGFVSWRRMEKRQNVISDNA